MSQARSIGSRRYAATCLFPTCYRNEPGDVGSQARNNTIEQFKLAFDPQGMEAVLSRMERNETIANQFMSNEQLRAVALELMMQQVYEHFTNQSPEAA